jgi:Gram-negative bacterial TonB protein C-terminal
MKKLFLAIAVLFFLNESFAQETKLIDMPPPPPQIKIKKSKKSNGKEKDAEFEAGAKAWGKFLKANLDATVPYLNKAKPGVYNVIIMFAVNKNGEINDLLALTKNGFGMEEEAMRVIKLSPKWKPATMSNGDAVNCIKRQPFTFEVSEQ